jgi:hypothetical protein
MKLTDLSRPSSGDRNRPRKSRAKPGAKRGRPKGVKNLLTLERELQAKLDGGEELAKTWLVETMQIAGRMMRRYCPIDQHSNNKRAGGDVEKFYRACELVTRTGRSKCLMSSPSRHQLKPEEMTPRTSASSKRPRGGERDCLRVVCPEPRLRPNGDLQASRDRRSEDVCILPIVSNPWVAVPA